MMVSKEVLLVKKDGGKIFLEQKPNGSLWQNGEKLFATVAEAGQIGWKVDAVKVRLGSAGEGQRRQ